MDDALSGENWGCGNPRLLRAVDDPNFVMIDLEFDSAAQAEALLAAMRVVWGEVQGTIMTNPEARIVEAVESRQF